VRFAGEFDLAIPTCNSKRTIVGIKISWFGILAKFAATCP
jgi:hypothetical protein